MTGLLPTAQEYRNRAEEFLLRGQQAAEQANDWRAVVAYAALAEATLLAAEVVPEMVSDRLSYPLESGDRWAPRGPIGDGYVPTMGTRPAGSYLPDADDVERDQPAADER